MQKYYAIDLSEDDGPMRAPVYKSADVADLLSGIERSHRDAVTALKGDLAQAQAAIQRMTVEAKAADEKYRALPKDADIAATFETVLNIIRPKLREKIGQSEATQLLQSVRDEWHSH